MSISGPSRLEKSIEDFKLSLRPEDHHTLKNFPDPSPEDVAKFVKDLDAKLQQKQKRRKTLQSSPFTTFVQSMQQFSSIVDTCVQSNPEIAALVWGGMKLVLLTFSNYLKYLEEIVDMCDQMGRLCPQFERFSKLFPKHKELQSAICEFYAIIVDFFREALVFLYGSVFKQLAIATFRPFEEKFSDILKSLDLARKIIDREITLSSEQELHIDRINNAQLRTDVRDLCHFTRVNYQHYHDDRIQLNEEAQRSKRERVLQNISKYPYYSDFTNNLQKRIENSGLWIYKTLEYESWFHSPGSSGLWYHAIPGFGKSVLTAGVIDTLLDLSKSQRSQRHYVAYFFCTYTTASSLLAHTILSSLLHQMFYYSQDLPRDLVEDIQSRFENRASSSRVVLSDIQRFITKIIENNQAINYIVVDGLDECNDKERGIILRILKKILKDVPQAIKILISSRGSQDIARALQNFQQLNLGTSNQEDVDAFISQTLHNKELEGQLPELSGDLFAKVKSFLSENAKGLFIWVDLQIEEICKEARPEDIVAVLPTLPKDLDELYDRVINRIVRVRRPGVAHEIFKWVAYAIRPLTLEELKEATCLRDTQISSWAELHKLAEVDESKWLQNCENLVTVNRDRGTVQFAHSTVKEFLESGKCSEKIFSMDKLSHNQLAEACVRYYKFPEIIGPDSQHQRMAVSKKGLNSLAMIARNPVESDTSWTSWMTRKLYQHTSRFTNISSTPNSTVSAALIKTEDSNIIASQKQTFKYALRAYPFLEYATSCWIFHYIEAIPTPTRAVFDERVPTVWVPQGELSKLQGVRLPPGNTLREWPGPRRLPLPMKLRGYETFIGWEEDICLDDFGAEARAPRIYNLILQRFHSIRFPWQNHFTPESLTLEEGLFELFDWALDNGVGLIFQLAWACCMSLNPIPGLHTAALLKYWLPLNYTPGDLAENRFERLCFKKDADTAGIWDSVCLVVSDDIFRKGSPLFPGYPGGRLSKEPNYLSFYLHYACGQGDTLLFNYLTEILGYLPNAFEGDQFHQCKYISQISYQNIVREAIEGNSLKILQALHKQEYRNFITQVSQEDQFKLLEFATELGKHGFLKELIPHYRFGLIGSNTSGSSILQRAVEAGEEDIVKACLQRSTDLLSRSRANRFYPLQIAARNNDLGLIKVMAPFLDKKKAHVDMTAPYTSDTSLTYAIMNKNTEMVRILLEAGADLSIKPRKQVFASEFHDLEEVISPDANYPMLQFASTPSLEIFNLFWDRDKYGFLELIHGHNVPTTRLIRLAKYAGNPAWAVVEKIMKEVEDASPSAKMSERSQIRLNIFHQIKDGLALP
ncbi:uncharacterized protein DFL_004190 [Arthrobotrys flagrans]|uniref:Uncharacterized protein n=1 Tax=Arthrobotrys flagrans TaxID=97331 RepID=A0A437A3Z8_ARTFL|nr:hypothetical protein DFL_004190 [Arthrobotrys flagrans]